MSLATIHEIVRRAREDLQFLHLLVSAPAQAITGLDLTPHEIGALTTRTPEDLLRLLASGGEMLACEPNTCVVTCDFTCSNSLVEACDRTVIGEDPGQSPRLKDLITRATADPAFFRALVEHPEETLKAFSSSRASRQTGETRGGLRGVENARDRRGPQFPEDLRMHASAGSAACGCRL